MEEIENIYQVQNDFVTLYVTTNSLNLRPDSVGWSTFPKTRNISQISKELSSYQSSIIFPKDSKSPFILLFVCYVQRPGLDFTRAASAVENTVN